MSKRLSLAGALMAGPLLAGIVVGILGAPSSWAQPTIAPPEFEVASVKPMPQSSPQHPETGGPGTTDPGQITWSGVRLRWLLKTAYDVELYQISGPAWLDSEHYMIVAKVPEGATKEQVNLMWQNLLKDRFGVAVHHESREFQGEEMTLPKGAFKLKETDLPDSPAPTMPGTASNGLIVTGDGDTRRILARAQSMAQAAAFLAQVAGHPVIDKTGLTGRYDFSVEFDISQPCVSCAIAIALEQELGLKVVKSTVRLDVIVVDHAERTPVEN
jgi:uncharacterized protein (TIGR03435 family)